MIDFSKVLLVSDYDRTMTGFDGAIPPSNLAAVEEFVALGGAFTIATGRSRPMFRRPMQQLQVSAPVILSNGGGLWEPDSDRITVLHPMTEVDLAAVREIAGQYPQLRLELQGLRGHRCFGPDPLRDQYMHRYGMEPDYGGWEGMTDTYLAACLYAPFQTDRHATAAETCDEDERPFEEIQAWVEAEHPQHLMAVRSMPRMIEIQSRDCGKGSAARELARRMGRTVLLCTGDAPNDLTMLEEADEAFVPATADPAMLSCGFTEVASCDEGTIAAIVEVLKRR